MRSSGTSGVEQQAGVAPGQHLNLGHVLRGAHVLTPLSLHPAPPGDIAALKDMPLEQLYLDHCSKLKGKPVVRVG